MRNVFLFLASCFLMLGCTSKTPGEPPPIVTVGCAVELSLSGSIASGLSTTLTCSHQDVIQTDILAAMGKANLCTRYSSARAQIAAKKSAGQNSSAMDDKAIVGNLICPPVASALGAMFISTIPASWGCSPSATVGAATAALTSLCEAAVPL